jgi:hypothetical protein
MERSPAGQTQSVGDDGLKLAACVPPALITSGSANASRSSAPRGPAPRRAKAGAKDVQDPLPGNRYGPARGVRDQPRHVAHRPPRGQRPRSGT